MLLLFLSICLFICSKMLIFVLFEKKKPRIDDKFVLSRIE